MIKIALVTSTRAEYGLCRPLIKRLSEDKEIDFSLVVTGTHLLNSYGKTIDEIKSDGFRISHCISIFEEEKNNTDEVMARTITKFSELFSSNRYDFLVVDGDRFEMFAVCIAAVLNNIPIAHCGGGETTEGANDEYWRHCMTKLSYLHFPIMDEYANRIVQMGEDPNRVFNVGSLGLENIRSMQFKSKEEVSNRVGIKLRDKYALVTFHPATLEDEDALTQVRELLDSLDMFPDMDFIITKSNADNKGDEINNILDDYAKCRENVACVSSLGTVYYLSAMNYASMVIGNSSSGIIETPSFKIPTINIGDRQKGRVQATSIINCLAKKEDIVSAINKALSDSFRIVCSNTINPNGNGDTSYKIVENIKKSFKNGIALQKSFYNIKISERTNDV